MTSSFYVLVVVGYTTTTFFQIFIFVKFSYILYIYHTHTTR